MKKTAVLLLLLCMLSTVAFSAPNVYVRLSPVGARFGLYGGQHEHEFHYNMKSDVVSYFVGGTHKETDVSQKQIPGQYVSTSGYVPMRYLIVDQNSVEDKDLISYGKTMGLHFSFDGTWDFDSFKWLADSGSEFNENWIGGQVNLGFAMRQFLTPSMYVYENVGVSAGSWLLGGYADVGFAVDLGSFSVNLGAKADAGVFVPTSGAFEFDFDFENAEPAVTVTPYFGLGFGF